MGVETIGLILSGLAAGGSAYQQQRTADNQAKTVILGQQRQAERQREADAAVNAELESMQASTPEQERTRAAAGFVEQLRRNRAQATGEGQQGAVSSRFAGDVMQAGDDVADYGARTADVMSRIMAPTLQRQGEGQGFARLASRLGTIGSNAAGDDFITQLRLRAAQPNPWGQAATGVAGGVGNALATRAPVGGTAKPVEGGMSVKPVRRIGDQFKR